MPCSHSRAALAAALAALALAPESDACVGFATGVSYSVGDAPYAVALADFNRDGKLDLATANSGTNNVTIRPGTGNGTFGAATSFAAGTAPSYLLAADFDNDGQIDLAVTNLTSGDVSILLGDGAGSFAAAVNYSVGASPFGLAAADFDRDGVLDLAVANFGAGTVSILLGDGDGTFTATTDVTAAGAVALATGDFNRDGKTDLAAARFYDGIVAVFLGVGDGTFTFGSNLGAGLNPRAIAAGDFNGDGRVDLASGDQASGNVSVFLGNGNGTFAAAVNYAVMVALRSLIVADVTADGIADLAAASTNASSNVSILRGNGNGTFAAAVHFNAGNGPRGIAAGLIEAYPPVDLVVANETSNDVTVLANQSYCSTNCGSLAPAVNYTSGDRPRKPAVGDFNQDGKPDLAVPNEYVNKVSIHLGNGDGTFAAPTTLLTTGSNPWVVVSADFNRDGKADLVVGHGVGTSLSVFLGVGDGTFTTAASPVSGAAAGELVVADFNRDGILDLGALQTLFYSVGIFLGNGDGTFGAVSSVPASSGGPQSVTTGDFNRDGKPDLATANSGNNTVSVLLGNGDGTFAAFVPYVVSSYAYEVITGDMNRDGRTDLVVGRHPNILSVLHGAGDGTFGAPVNSTVGGAPIELALIDSGASYPVVLGSQGSSSLVAYMFVDPATSMVTSTTTYATPSTPGAVISGDFNRDGRADAAVSNLYGGNVSVLLNFCETTTLLTQSSGTTPHGFPVTFTAEVAGESALIGPTGSVTFKDGATILGTVSIDQSYMATYTTSQLSIGTHSITATYNGNSIFAPSTSTALTQTVEMGPPTEVYAIPNAAGTQVNVFWNTALAADSYEVWKSFNGSAFALLSGTAALTVQDNAVSPNVAYVYQVRSIAGATQSVFSRPTIATTIQFTDDPLVAQSTIIKQIHLTQLRSGVNMVRTSAGLDSYSFTDSPPVVVKHVHRTELYTALSEAWVALGLDPLLTPGLSDSIVRALDFKFIRDIVHSAPYGGAPN